MVDAVRITIEAEDIKNGYLTLKQPAYGMTDIRLPLSKDVKVGDTVHIPIPTRAKVPL